MAFRRRKQSASTSNTGQKADKFGQVAIGVEEIRRKRATGQFSRGNAWALELGTDLVRCTLLARPEG
jgi:hypothetical protein